MSRKRKQKAAALDALYARMPTIACKGLCWDACGPIGMTEFEATRIEAYLGRPLPAARDMTCPFLTVEGRCGVYPVRPIICRLWGVDQELRCPHGCEGSGSLPAGEAVRLILEVELLSGGEPVLLYPPEWKRERFW